MDKQLNLVCRKLGASSRIDAARRLHDYEAWVQSLNTRVKTIAFTCVVMAAAEQGAPVNTLTRQQGVARAMILAVAMATTITVAAMFILAIALLLGVHL